MQEPDSMLDQLPRDNVDVIMSLLMATNPSRTHSLSNATSRPRDENGFYVPSASIPSDPLVADRSFPIPEPYVPKHIESPSDLFGDFSSPAYSDCFFDRLSGDERPPPIQLSSGSSTVLSLLTVQDQHSDLLNEYRSRNEERVVDVAERANRRRIEKRLCVYRELLSTEETFVRSIQLFQAFYVNPMSEIEDPAVQSLQNQLRVSMELILGVNGPFLEKLRALFEGGGEPQGVEDLLIAQCPVFKLYVQYLNFYAKGLRQSNLLMESNEEFEAFVTRQSKNLQKRGERASTIRSFLSMPVQRLPRYGLLMSDLRRKTDPTHPAYEKICSAAEEVRKIADYVNERKKEIVNAMRVIELAKKYRLRDLVLAARKLKDTFPCTIDNHPGEMNLFNDLVLFVRRNRPIRMDFDESGLRCFPHLTEPETLIVESERDQLVCKMESPQICQTVLETLTAAFSASERSPEDGEEEGEEAAREAASTSRRGRRRGAKKQTPRLREVFFGELLKEGGGPLRTKFQKRFFVITEDKQVAYYDRRGGRERGSFNLVNASYGLAPLKRRRQKQKQNMFYIKNQRRNYWLVASSMEELEEWLTILDIVGANRVDLD